MIQFYRRAIAPTSGATLSAIDVDDHEAYLGTLSDQRDPLTRYFEAPEPDRSAALERLLADPPGAGYVVSFALRNPGISTQDRAVELLGRLPARTLQFARQYGANETFYRVVYSNKVWEIVIGALGLVDQQYADHSREFVTRHFASSANPVQRLAAFDALESLERD